MREYATNQDRWINYFVAVFDKMMANGYDSLEEELVGDTRFSGRTPTPTPSSWSMWGPGG